jgi:hypothetical protein
MSFPYEDGIFEDSELEMLNQELMQALCDNAERKTIRTRDGHTIIYGEYVISASKPLIDRVDRVLAEHYGFTDEELDFIINYDVKYRMGLSATGADEE